MTSFWVKDLLFWLFLGTCLKPAFQFINARLFDVNRGCYPPGPPNRGPSGGYPPPFGTKGGGTPLLGPLFGGPWKSPLAVICCPPAPSFGREGYPPLWHKGGGTPPFGTKGGGTPPLFGPFLGQKGGYPPPFWSKGGGYPPFWTLFGVQNGLFGPFLGQKGGVFDPPPGPI